MNREIKFRAWWSGVNQMKYFIPGNFEDTRNGWAMTFIQPQNEKETIYIGKSEIMQYTGSIDADGNEIYEGDIYRMEEETDEGDNRTYFVCHYIKEWGMFAWLTTDELNDYNESGLESLDEPMYWTFPIRPKDTQKIKLCGNIYENPDLLK